MKIITFTFKRGLNTVAMITGRPLVDKEMPTAEEVLEMEQKLERWLGTRLHIWFETIEEEKKQEDKKEEEKEK